MGARLVPGLGRPRERGRHAARADTPRSSRLPLAALAAPVRRARTALTGLVLGLPYDRGCEMQGLLRGRLAAAPYGRRMTRITLISLLVVALLAGCNSDELGPRRRREARQGEGPDHGQRELRRRRARGVRQGRQAGLRRPASHQVAQRVREGPRRQRGGQSDPRRQCRQGRPRLGRDARLRRARSHRVQPVARSAPHRLVRARGEGAQRRRRRPDARQPRRSRAPGHRRPARPAAPSAGQASTARTRRLGRRPHLRERRRPDRGGAALAWRDGLLRQPLRDRARRQARRNRDARRGGAGQPLPLRLPVSDGKCRPVAAPAGDLRGAGRELG